MFMGKNESQSGITPTPRGMGLSAPRSRDGGAVSGSPSHSATSSTTAPPSDRGLTTYRRQHEELYGTRA